MKKIGLLFILIASFLLSSCGYDTDYFFCNFQNENNENIYVSSLYGERKVGTDTGFITYLVFKIEKFENIDITVIVPNKVYVEKYEKYITLYALGAKPVVGTPVPIKSHIEIYVNQEHNPDVHYNFNIDCSGLTVGGVIESVHAYALNDGFDYSYCFV